MNPQTPVFTSSRLSKTLQEILHDKDALPYFIQYMQSRNAGHIIKFWLDAESFQASSWMRIRSSSLKTRSRSSSCTQSGSDDEPGSSAVGVAPGPASSSASFTCPTASSAATGSMALGSSASISVTATVVSQGQPDCICSRTNTASSGATTPSPSCAAHYHTPPSSPSSPSHYHSPSCDTDASHVPYSRHSPPSGDTQTGSHSQTAPSEVKTSSPTAEPSLPKPSNSQQPTVDWQEKLRKSMLCKCPPKTIQVPV